MRPAYTVAAVAQRLDFEPITPQERARWQASAGRRRQKEIRAWLLRIAIAKRYDQVRRYRPWSTLWDAFYKMYGSPLHDPNRPKARDPRRRSDISSRSLSPGAYRARGGPPGLRH